jgi:hypothetical protein
MARTKQNASKSCGAPAKRMTLTKVIGIAEKKKISIITRLETTKENDIVSSFLLLFFSLLTIK